ncbi:hypothetical protein BU204_24620 [Actinophytocola xanthii]|uniref:Uncharacterized protein n=1 Tax=Actinophytocola xanthii TaxID=1912961 RepID=A0A1Q8CKN1_9PSEU|nr:hypothetical protein BU204_24620 [Actinophytocola xanthii]
MLTAVATALLPCLLLSPAAEAGGWAETVLDPTPARVQARVTYTLGFWVLQHGSYPYQGDLGPVVLTARTEGEFLEFPATRAATPGHYSAEVVFPRDGVWLFGTRHGELAFDEDVAIVTVPGAFEISPSELATRAEHAWGAVRPSFPPSRPGAQVAAPSGEPVETVGALVEPRREEPAEQTAEQAAEREDPAALPVALVVGAGLATLALAGWLVRRHRRANRAG